MSRYFAYNVEIDGQYMRLHYQADCNERVKSFLEGVIRDCKDFSGITFKCYLDKEAKKSLETEKPKGKV